MFSKIKTFILDFIDDWMRELGGDKYSTILAALSLALIFACTGAVVIGLPYIGIPIIVITVLIYKRTVKKNEENK